MLDPSTKRKCIFTEEEAGSKLLILPKWVETHNWAKSVPCSKAYLEKRGDSPLSDIEFSLVELFFEKEIARIKILNIERKMHELRGSLHLRNKKVELSSREVEAADVFFQKETETETETETEDQKKSFGKSFNYSYYEFDKDLPLHMEGCDPGDFFEEIDLDNPTKDLTSDEKQNTIKKVVKKKTSLWD